MKAIFDRLAPNSIGVKICGITNAEDAALCVELGVDAVGFNFYPGSKRFLDLENERDWMRQVPDSILRVAVMVNPTEAEARAILREPFIDAIQLHGEETVQFCDSLRLRTEKPIIKALRIENAGTLRLAETFAAFPLLLDAFSPGERGGTGHAFDWDLLAGFPFLRQVILSGGLSIENVEAAVRLTGVRFLDLASGSEEHPRKKSREKIRGIVAKMRNLTETAKTPALS